MPWAEKKKQLVFNENSLRDYVTGFHERKVQRRKAAEKRKTDQLKHNRRKVRKETAKTLHKEYVKAEKLCKELKDMEEPETTQQEVVEPPPPKLSKETIKLKNKDFYNSSVQIIVQPLKF